MEPRHAKTVIDFLKRKGYKIPDNLEAIINDLIDEAKDNRDLMVLRGYDRKSLRFSTEEIVDYLERNQLL
jgi:hypothetical protein